MPCSKKLIILFVFFILSLSPVLANMAAPWIKGTNNSDGYINKKTDILHEQLNITILDPYTAIFDITYTIKSETSGTQIPIIFDDYQDYNDNPNSTFRVWLDAKEIKVVKVPSMYNDSIKEKWIHILRANYSSNASTLNAFKYFEVDLNKDSIHQIRVNYTATATINLSMLVRRYEFEYNLHPAKFWRNFSGLDITIDASKVGGEYISNLPDAIAFRGIQKLHFDNIPQDEFMIWYQPEISQVAQLFISIDPAGIATLITLFIAIAHIFIMYKYRKRNPFAKFPVIAIIGSIVIPFIFCVLYVYSFSLIDSIIGEHASRRHGYIFLIFFLYPFILIIYLIPSLLIDWIFKKNLKNKKTSN